MAVRPIPEGHHSVTPYLVVEGAARLLDFLKHAFGAEETSPRTSRPDGTIMHAEVRIGDSRVMLGEPMGEFKAMPASLYLYVNDCDAVYKRAMQAGAASVMEPADQFYGDRNAGVKDPSGNIWWVATHKEDVSPEEMKRRTEAMMKQRHGA
jgi:PhnB protein